MRGSGMAPVGARESHLRSFLGFKNTPQLVAAKIETDW